MPCKQRDLGSESWLSRHIPHPVPCQPHHQGHTQLSRMTLPWFLTHLITTLCLSMNTGSHLGVWAYQTGRRVGRPHRTAGASGLGSSEPQSRGGKASGQPGRGPDRLGGVHRRALPCGTETPAHGHIPVTAKSQRETSSEGKGCDLGAKAQMCSKGVWGVPSSFRRNSPLHCAATQLRPSSTGPDFTAPTSKPGSSPIFSLIFSALKISRAPVLLH